jgi:site-specific DNA-methyltransferase (adenine-specific)
MPLVLSQCVNRILCGDALSILKKLPAESIDCVVTSPPYWSLRDYGVPGQLGLEASVDQYLIKLLAVLDEVRRVLKPQGTCWVNLGDVYSTRSSKKGGKHPSKCLLQIPSRFALGMTDRGWILRNEIIWHKPNCMPQSVKDRFTVDFEKLFFFVKSRYYYFSQQFEPLRYAPRLRHSASNANHKAKRRYGDLFISSINPHTAEASRLRVLARGRNKRCVWKISTRPFYGRHFAVYPEELVETPIRAGCPEGGVILDPFSGSGTTLLVARRLGRNFIGIDLNPKYVRMSEERLAKAA